MFDWNENRFLVKGLKDWAHSCSQSTCLSEKYLDRKYAWHCFWKDERSWWDGKQEKRLWERSRPKGSLKKMLWEILQNSQENICARISSLVFSCQFFGICKNIFLVEQYRLINSDYSSINSSERIIGKRNCNHDTQTKGYVFIWAKSVSYSEVSPGKITGFRSSLSQTSN